MPKSRRNLTVSQLRVGIFVLAALIILGFLILNSTGDFNPFEKRMHLKARFVSADGLHSSAEVQLAGVTVGKVEDVRFLPPDTPTDEHVEATLKIQRDFQGRPITEYIRTDSTAQLIATSVLGNEKMINITPGTSKGDPIAENAVLESSSPISINQLTETGNDLLKQIDKLAVPANEILNKANRGEGTLGRIINDESLYKNLDTTVAQTKDTMTRLQTTLDKINKGQGSAGKLLNDPALYDSLNKTVSQLQLVAADLHAGRGSAGKFLNNDELYNETRAAVADLRVSAEKINSIADDFKSISADLAAGKGSAGRFLKDEQLYDDARDTLARLNSTSTKLESLITDAQSGKGTIGKLFTDETLFNNVNQTASNINQLSSEGTKLIYDFRQNPRKYLRVKVSIF